MTFQSRWGFHPCDYETYLGLRKLHKAFWEGLRLMAKWKRWNAKLPKNRTQPEPKVPAVYREICASVIIVEYQSARHAVPRPEDVISLTIPVGRKDHWLRQLEELDLE